MKDKTNNYLHKYWDILINIKNQSDIKVVMDEMLVEIKKSLSTFKFISVYGGYQHIAEIWKNSLQEDLELIALSDFYTIARNREPYMVTKGSGDKKREEQDGWISSIIPNELIISQLYDGQASKIENLKVEVSEIEMELDELADQLEGVELTDNEFSQVMTKVSQIDNSFEAAKILAMEGSTGKIDDTYGSSTCR